MHKIIIINRWQCIGSCLPVHADFFPVLVNPKPFLWVCCWFFFAIFLLLNTLKIAFVYFFFLFLFCLLPPAQRHNMRYVNVQPQCNLINLITMTVLQVKCHNDKTTKYYIKEPSAIKKKKTLNGTLSLRHTHIHKHMHAHHQTELFCCHLIVLPIFNVVRHIVVDCCPFLVLRCLLLSLHCCHWLL